ncbi:MAG: hypothetical protein HZB51_29660 [Chloroflexi bacterium]|nr:hypothetical protein [Chloroflexota bacterium]
MEINLGAEQIVELPAVFSLEQIQEKALAKRVDAFGQMAKFVQRPKLDDIEITTTQKRLEPFWFACATARYVYDRKATYRVPASPEAQSVILNGIEYTVTGDKTRTFSLEGLERCVEETSQSLMLDTVGGKEVKYEKYLSFPKNLVTDMAALEQNGTFVVAPEVRSSFIVRKLASMLMKTFQADKIVEERIDVSEVTLYYRPIFAVEYFWRAKDKKQVVEFDGLTGEAKAESGEIKKKVVSVLENDALFDIGADAVGTVFPGVNVAIKLGRLAARKAIK